MHEAYDTRRVPDPPPPQVFQLRKIDALRSMHMAHFARLLCGGGTGTVPVSLQYTLILPTWWVAGKVLHFPGSQLHLWIESCSYGLNPGTFCVRVCRRVIARCCCCQQLIGGSSA